VRETDHPSHFVLVLVSKIWHNRRVSERMTPTTIDDAQRELERLRREVEHSEKECERLRDENVQLKRERDRLRRENERLTQALEGARRAGQRQAAPFSKGAPTFHPQVPGRRPGRGYGPHGHRQPPALIDEIVDVPLPDVCPRCGGAIAEMRVADQIQEELPVVQPHVRRFHVHIGRCRQCGHRVQGRHPLQTSDALGAAKTHLGPQAVALIVLLNKYLGLSHGKVATLLRDWFGLTLRPSAVTHALHRAARQAAPTYDALRDAIRASPFVSPDETSWKVAGRLQWLWAFATPSIIVYAIQAGRGFPQAAAVLGADFDGVLVRDGWAPYRRFQQAAHQTCLAHLLRRARELASDHPRAAWPARVHDVLRDALEVRDRRDAGEITTHGAAIARGRLFNRLADLVSQPTRDPARQRFAAHLAIELPAVFGFLFDPAVDATNWRAEQALRPAVVNRKVSGGNRSPRGAVTQQILASVVHTARLRRLDARAILVDLLRARQPIASSALATPQ
jgi:transposase